MSRKILALARDQQDEIAGHIGDRENEWDEDDGEDEAET